VPADPRRLKQPLEDWNGSRCGVSKKRFANVKSHLNRALELAGAVVVDASRF
jgi:hypothetical protein